MPSSRRYLFLLVSTLLGSCLDDGHQATPGSDSMGGSDSSDTSIATGSGSTAVSTTAEVPTSTGNSGDSDPDSTSTTGEMSSCAKLVWQGDFIGTPAELANYTEVTGVVRVRETDATDLQGMDCLERVGGFLEIRGNTALTALDGAERLKQVGTLLIVDNPVLVSIAGLQSLAIVDSRARIGDNPMLTNLHGLEGLTQTGENLEIAGNGALLDLQGLGSLATVGGTLLLSSNDSLLSCVGPSVLTSTGSVDVWSNAVLVDLDGLGSIVDLRFELRVTANPAITSLTGVSGASVHSDGRVEIKDNSSLPQCDAQAVSDAVTPLDFTGQIEVTGNQGTCP